MFPILTDDFLTSLEKLWGSEFNTCTCGKNCKCQKNLPQEEEVIDLELPTEVDEAALSLLDSSSMWVDNGDSYVLSLVLPCDKENISVEVLNCSRVKIDYKQDTIHETANSYESYSCKGSMQYEIPVDGVQSSLSAEFKDHFLRLRVDKISVEPYEENRTIEIK